MLNWLAFDFGYSWPFTRGHLLLALIAAVLATIGLRRHWHAWLTGILFATTAWGLAGAVIMHDVVQINAPQRIPTDGFLSDVPGRVLDLGAGSGRGTVGLLLARPRLTATALDRYEGYFGIEDNTPERLRANARIAGVDNRVRVQVGDMRQLPFESGSFEGAISIAAIDHLSWPDIERTLRETARVLVPDGQLLIVGLNPDVWIRIAVPWSIHGGFWGHAPSRDRWRQTLERCGFIVTEVSTRPALMYILATRKAVTIDDGHPEVESCPNFHPPPLP